MSGRMRKGYRPTNMQEKRLVAADVVRQDALARNWLRKDDNAPANNRPVVFGRPPSGGSGRSSVPTFGGLRDLFESDYAARTQQECNRTRGGGSSRPVSAAAARPWSGLGKGRPATAGPGRAISRPVSASSGVPSASAARPTSAPAEQPRLQLGRTNGGIIIVTCCQVENTSCGTAGGGGGGGGGDQMVWSSRQGLDTNKQQQQQQKRPATAAANGRRPPVGGAPHSRQGHQQLRQNRPSSAALQQLTGSTNRSSGAPHCSTHTTNRPLSAPPRTFQPPPPPPQQQQQQQPQQPQQQQPQQPQQPKSDWESVAEPDPDTGRQLAAASVVVGHAPADGGSAATIPASVFVDDTPVRGFKAANARTGSSISREPDSVTEEAFFNAPQRVQLRVLHEWQRDDLRLAKNLMRTEQGLEKAKTGLSAQEAASVNRLLRHGGARNARKPRGGEDVVSAPRRNGGDEVIKHYTTTMGELTNHDMRRNI